MVYVQWTLTRTVRQRQDWSLSIDDDSFILEAVDCRSSIASIALLNMSAVNSNTVDIKATDAHAFAVDILTHSQVPREHAETIAKSLVLADLRGIDTHGINRLAGYLKRIEAGVLNPNPKIEFVQKSPVFAHLDAQNTFGFVAGSAAVAKAISMAETFGVGIAGVKNSGHFGMAATYLLQAFEKGFAAMVFTNASRSMPAWGAKEPLLGTSPFAVGLPGGKKGNFVLDMSPSVVARVSRIPSWSAHLLFQALGAVEG